GSRREAPGAGAGEGGALTIGSTEQDYSVLPASGGPRAGMGDAMPRGEAPFYGQEVAPTARLGSVLPPVIGHRGAAACAPENTLAGLRKASELGCRWVEFDVRLTADGHLILLHDDRVERTTDGRGSAAALLLATLRRYDAGAWFGRRF